MPSLRPPHDNRGGATIVKLDDFELTVLANLPVEPSAQALVVLAEALDLPRAHNRPAQERIRRAIDAIIERLGGLFIMVSPTGRTLLYGLRRQDIQIARDLCDRSGIYR